MERYYGLSGDAVVVGKRGQLRDIRINAEVQALEAVRVRGVEPDSFIHRGNSG